MVLSDALIFKEILQPQTQQVMTLLIIRYT